MKEKIHPNYKETTIICACGEVIHTRSTKENIHVEICSKCHPFFTGKQKILDSAGRVDKFKKRYEKRTPAARKDKGESKKDDKTISIQDKLNAKEAEINKRGWISNNSDYYLSCHDRTTFLFFTRFTQVILLIGPSSRKTFMRS